MNRTAGGGRPGDREAAAAPRRRTAVPGDTLWNPESSAADGAHRPKSKVDRTDSWDVRAGITARPGGHGGRPESCATGALKHAAATRNSPAFSSQPRAPKAASVVFTQLLGKCGKATREKANQPTTLSTLLTYTQFFSFSLPFPRSGAFFSPTDLRADTSESKRSKSGPPRSRPCPRRLGQEGLFSARRDGGGGCAAPRSLEGSTPVPRAPGATGRATRDTVRRRKGQPQPRGRLGRPCGGSRGAERRALPGRRGRARTRARAAARAVAMGEGRGEAAGARARRAPREGEGSPASQGVRAS